VRKTRSVFNFFNGLQLRLVLPHHLRLYLNFVLQCLVAKVPVGCVFCVGAHVRLYQRGCNAHLADLEGFRRRVNMERSVRMGKLIGGF